MAWSLLAHTEGNFGSGTAGGTTTGVDTTGATLLLVSIMCYQGSGSNSPYPSGAGQFTDSYSNTWTLRENFSCGANGGTQDFHLYLFECVSPTVGTGHTFTITTGNICYPNLAMEAWSGNLASSPFDQLSYAVDDTFAAGKTGHCGSLTPAQSGSLIYTAASAANGTGSPYSVDSSVTIDDQSNGVGSHSYGLAHGHYVQGAAAAINPQWTITTAGGSVWPLGQAIYKPAVSSASPWFPMSYDMPLRDMGLINMVST